MSKTFHLMTRSNTLVGAGSVVMNAIVIPRKCTLEYIDITGSHTPDAAGAYTSGYVTVGRGSAVGLEDSDSGRMLANSNGGTALSGIVNFNRQVMMKMPLNANELIYVQIGGVANSRTTATVTLCISF